MGEWEPLLCVLQRGCEEEIATGDLSKEYVLLRFAIGWELRGVSKRLCVFVEFPFAPLEMFGLG